MTTESSRGDTAPELTGAEILIRCLQEENVEHVFGYPGGAVLYLYDALFQQDKVKHILVRHEQGAVPRGAVRQAHRERQIRTMGPKPQGRVWRISCLPGPHLEGGTHVVKAG